MKVSRARALAVSSTAIVAVMGGHVPQASAQTLFDLLFKNERRVVREAPPEPAPVVQRAAPPRVSGPSYYTYKTDPLVKVDFAAIRPDRSDDAAMMPEVGIDNSSVASTDMAPAIEVAQIIETGTATDVSPESDAVPEPDDASIEADEVSVEVPAADNELANAPVEDDEEGDGAAAAAAPLESVDPAVDPLAEALVEAEPIDQPVEAEATPVETPEAAEVEEQLASPVTDDPIQAPQAQATETAEPEPEPVIVSTPEPLSDEQIASLQDFELLAEEETAEAIVAHYTAVPEFIWISDGQVNERARSAMSALGEAASHGLDPRDYAVTVPAGSTETDLARFEMELSARLLRYVRDARSGRIDPNRISGYHDFAPKPLDQIAALQGVREADDMAAFLEAQHPQNAHYRALRVELEALKASSENEIVVAPGTLIKPGQTNAEFPKILALIDRDADEAFRAEYGAVLASHLGSEVYAQELVPVIKAAQRAAGLGDDGIIGPRTVQALAGESKADSIRKVEVALEQLRWLPSDLGDRHVFLNAAAFNATYVEGGREKLSMRTIVGGLSTQTYFFQDEIEYVEFHPYWGVPRSILVNKYLPKLYSDPGYLDRNGFEVVNSRGQRVSSSSVDWGSYGANIPFDVRQKPGGGNALGEMKIMFPNRHAIYMHDTPDKSLFNRDNRALSNGCVRLADPRAMAAAVLGWSRTDIEQRLAQPHSREDLSVKVPVYVTYFTAWPSEAGEVSYYNDVYSRDDKVRAAIEKVEALRRPAA